MTQSKILLLAIGAGIVVLAVLIVVIIVSLVKIHKKNSPAADLKEMAASDLVR